MANYTAADVKTLRERSGAGMMDCKNALDEANGDLEKAMELLRLKGLKGVTKREGRTTSNGLIVARTGAGRGMLLELACETDFVSKAAKFVELADRVADAVFASASESVADALAVKLGDSTVEDAIVAEAAVIGEKLELRKIGVLKAAGIDAYLHRTSPDLPPQVGVLVAYEGGDSAVAHDISVHIAAFSPTYLSREDVPGAVVEKEREIAFETAKNEGKPEAALPKIVEGRVNGFFKENVLVEQDFAKDNKLTVSKVAEAAGIKLSGFLRFRVGV
jgi:elongation factor Ts